MAENQRQTETETETKPRTQTQPELPAFEKAPFMKSSIILERVQTFWSSASLNLKTLENFQQNFHARDTDIILTSFPKTGTTWMKALLFGVVNRHTQKHLLLSRNAHDLVPMLDMNIFGEGPIALSTTLRPHHLDDLPSPRLFHSHVPYSALPKSIISSKSKLVYIARNPFDALVSTWHFYPNVIKNLTGDQNYQKPSIEEFFEDFYNGIIPFAPFFEHVLGYWYKSRDDPDKVLFLTYEDLKQDPASQLRKLADFVGVPFTPEEESEGVIDEIIQLCSIKNMKNLDVNKNGLTFNKYESKTFFRKGDVGDWTNYFTPDLTERMTKWMDEKLKGSGFTFKLLP